MQEETKEKATLKCDECKDKDAKWFCTTCKIMMFEEYNEHMHKYKALSKHIGEPVNSVNILPDPECKEHMTTELGMYCKSFRKIQ